MGHHYYQDRKLSKKYQSCSIRIIFIDDIDKVNLKLYDRYESRNKEGKLEKYNLLTRIYVQMPYINLIKKQKKLEEFSEVEKGIYIFENGITDDIIKLKGYNKVMAIMKDKLFNKYYSKEDDSILENLNSEEYDKIFEMILDNRSIEEIKIVLK